MTATPFGELRRCQREAREPVGVLGFKGDDLIRHSNVTKD